MYVKRLCVKSFKTDTYYCHWIVGRHSQSNALFYDRGKESIGFSASQCSRMNAPV